MLQNFLLLTGTIVGAGIFSLPYVMQKLNFLYPILLFIFTLISILLTLLYLRLIRTIKEKHQLPGFISHILGKNWGKLSSFLLLFSTGGALLAYLILGGQFINNIWLFYFFVGIIYLLKPKVMEKWSDSLTAALIFALILLVALNLKPIKFTVPSFSLRSVFEGYGAILFSLTGFSIIPELNYNDKKIVFSIFATYFVVFILYLLFAVFVNPDRSILFSLVGFLAITTSYLPLSLVFEDCLKRDLQVAKTPAKTITVLLPVIMYLFGFHNFLSILSFTGAVFIGGLALLIIFSYLKIGKRSFGERLLVAVAGLFFAVGLLGELLLNLF